MGHSAKSKRKRTSYMCYWGKRAFSLWPEIYWENYTGPALFFIATADVKNLFYSRMFWESGKFCSQFLKYWCVNHKERETKRHCLHFPWTSFMESLIYSPGFLWVFNMGTRAFNFFKRLISGKRTHSPVRIGATVNNRLLPDSDFDQVKIYKRSWNHEKSIRSDKNRCRYSKSICWVPVVSSKKQRRIIVAALSDLDLSV
jgi:hypothetical protein